MVSLGRTICAGLLVVALGLVATPSLGAAPVSPPGKPQSARQTAPTPAQTKPDRQQSLTEYERETLAADRIANGIGERANRIAEAQRVYGLLQLFLGGLVVIFTGAAAYFAYRATHWAKAAANAASESAKADNAALAATLAAAEEARKDATEQAKRFDAQIKVSQEGVVAARAATIEADRAWLSVFALQNSPLVFEEDEVWTTIYLQCVNRGRSPAIGVLWDCQLFASIGDAIESIRKHTRDSFAVPGLSHGQVIFPRDDDTRESQSISMSRTSFVQTAQDYRALEEPSDIDGTTLPAIVVGVQYCLPGETMRRFTYSVYGLSKADGGVIFFDGSKGSFDTKLEFINGGPIT